MFPTQSDNMRIVIREVNMTNNYVSGTDAYGKTYQMMFDFHDAVVTIPVVGEMWLCTRRGNDWLLFKRLETGNEQISITTLDSGDKRLEAVNDLWLSGARVMINGASINNIVPAGIVVPYAGSTAPQGWEFADGGSLNAISNSQYLSLYNAIGVLYGGSGPEDFNKPDLRGRIPVGKGTHSDVLTLGASDGNTVENRTMKHYHAKGTLAIGASGAHSHTFTGSAVTSGAGSPHAHNAGTFAVSGTTGTESAHTHAAGTFAISGGSHSHSLTDVGGYSTTAATGSLNLGTGDRSGVSTGTSTGSVAHTHPASEWSGASAAGSAHSHTFSASATGASATESTHTHSVTATGTLSATDTHTHTNADFTGNVGTTTGIAETPAYIVLNYIIKI